MIFSAKLISYLLQRLGLSIWDNGIYSEAYDIYKSFYEIIFVILGGITPVIVYFYMLYLMRLHHNFQYLRQRRELVVFGGALIAFILASFIGMASVSPTVTIWSKCIHTQIKNTTTIVVDLCDGNINYFPLYSSNFGMEYMLFFLIILYFKQSEDYIANYS